MYDLRALVSKVQVWVLELCLLGMVCEFRFRGLRVLLKVLVVSSQT